MRSGPSTDASGNSTEGSAIVPRPVFTQTGTAPSIPPPKPEERRQLARKIVSAMHKQLWAKTTPEPVLSAGLTDQDLALLQREFVGLEICKDFLQVLLQEGNKPENRVRAGTGAGAKDDSKLEQVCDSDEVVLHFSGKVPGGGPCVHLRYRWMQGWKRADVYVMLVLSKDQPLHVFLPVRLVE